MKLPLQIILAVFLFSSARSVSSAQSATNLWALNLADYDCDSSPALAPDGTIYQGTFVGELVAVTPNGEIKWTFKAGREIKSSPAVAGDGTIYFGSRDRKFYALTPQGKLKWTFATGAWVDSSPAIAADGTIYFGSWDANFYALNPDGSLKWKFPTGGIIDSSPAIAVDGTIYFGSHDKKFYALRPDGKLLWSFSTGGQIVSSPAINSDGTIYFTSTDGNFYALRPDGSELWQLRTGGATESSPVLDGKGQIYIAINNGKDGISEAGKKIWFYGAALPIDATPAVAASGLVYFAAPWSNLEAFDSRGILQWTVRLPSTMSSSAVIGIDGTIYVNAGRYLTAITATNPAPPAKSSWPMFRANAQHTGRVQIVK